MGLFLIVNRKGCDIESISIAMYYVDINNTNQFVFDYILGGIVMNEKQIAQEILEKVGGENNIQSLTHCVTRLRFVLKDVDKAQTTKIEAIDGVISVLNQGGQYQVVIGPKVASVYNEIIKFTGMGNPDNESEEQNADEVIESKKSIIDRLTSMLSGIFLPVVSVLAGSGIIKGLLTLLSILNVISLGSSTYVILNAISDAMFYFFPIILGASASKYFKANMWIGAVLGAILVYPSVISLANTTISFVGLPLNVVNYSSSVFPAIVSAFVAAKLEHFLKKVIPEVIKFFAVPTIVLLVVAPLTLLVFGPVISYLTILLSNVIQAIYSFSPVLCGLLLGGPWILIVMLGLHWAGITILIIQFSTMGSAPLAGILIANQMAMAGAVFAIALKTKQQSLKTLSISTGISCILGVSEPALYGILVPQKKPLITAIIASSIASIFPAMMGTAAWVSAPVAGILGIFGYMNPVGVDAGFYGAIIAMTLGFGLGFLLTYLYGIAPNVLEESNGKNEPISVI